MSLGLGTEENSSSSARKEKEGFKNVYLVDCVASYWRKAAVEEQDLYGSAHASSVWNIGIS
jgi:hypothetical protein